jgi:hypothetical protein
MPKGMKDDFWILKPGRSHHHAYKEWIIFRKDMQRGDLKPFVIYNFEPNPG